jgi:hypothetical protein
MIIALWVAGTLADVVLVLANCPFQVTAGIALVILVLSMGRELLRGEGARRSRKPAVLPAAPRWTDAELAALDDAAGALVRLLEGLPEARRERTLP